MMLVHGMSVRSNIFNPPVARPLPHVLADAGYDVWMLNWRQASMSSRAISTLDDAAVHDHPAAVAKIGEVTCGTHDESNRAFARVRRVS